MKVLFVGRAKSEGVSPILYAQGSSLEKQGCALSYFALQKSGFWGYLSNLRKLRQYIRSTNPDIVHAHYSLTGFVAVLATRKPLVVSLMGSFPYKNWRYWLVQVCMSFFWKATIVKSERTARQLKRKNLHVIPNGVDLEFFSGADKAKLRKQFGWQEEDKIVLFAADPKRKVKNYPLAQQAVQTIADNKVKLLPIFDVTHQEMAAYMQAADALLLTSFSEGSPNVIKEALACSLPIVTTNVGDVSYLLDGVEGAYVANTFSPEEIATLLVKALAVKKTEGQQRIKALGLDSKQVAQQLAAIYNQVIK